MGLIRLAVSAAQVLQRPGKRSAQVVSRRNAPDARTTM